MARSATTAKPTPKAKLISSFAARKRALVTFGASAVGFVTAIPLTGAFMLSNAAPVVTRVIQAKPASDVVACSQPSTANTTTAAVGGGGVGHVLGESTAAVTTLPAGGQGGENQTPPPFVQRMLGGDLNAVGTISNTGPDSVNTVTSNQTETVKVTNNNNISVSNSNSQTANTGSASVEENTTAGTAMTGDSTNTNSTNLSFTVSN